MTDRCWIHLFNYFLSLLSSQNTHQAPRNKNLTSAAYCAWCGPATQATRGGAFIPHVSRTILCCEVRHSQRAADWVSAQMGLEKKSLKNVGAAGVQTANMKTDETHVAHAGNECGKWTECKFFRPNLQGGVICRNIPNQVAQQPSWTFILHLRNWNRHNKKQLLYFNLLRQTMEKTKWGGKKSQNLRQFKRKKLRLRTKVWMKLTCEVSFRVKYQG